MILKSQTTPKHSHDLRIIGFDTTLCSHVISKYRLCLYSLRQIFLKHNYVSGGLQRPNECIGSALEKA